MNKTFNIYCDESCHIEHDHKPYMFLGSISCAYNQTRLHTENIKELKKKHNLHTEIKWSKVSQPQLHFYLELIDYFFATDLKFRAIGIEKSKINNTNFNQTYDDFYYEMYYRLLNHRINSQYAYNVYLDIKDTLSARKVNRLKEILNVQYGVFRNVQNMHSHESVLMQFADFLVGAISYYKNNDEKKSKTKVQLIERIIKMSGHDFNKTNDSDKLNLFFIEWK
ncbi:MAG: DUF3800 domain-containing protein [Bacteroidales bacterium]|nr:DUF3800 domain-containing protein [Bacteroidales bacterium]